MAGHDAGWFIGETDTDTDTDDDGWFVDFDTVTETNTDDEGQRQCNKSRYKAVSQRVRGCTQCSAVNELLATPERQLHHDVVSLIMQYLQGIKPTMMTCDRCVRRTSLRDGRGELTQYCAPCAEEFLITCDCCWTSACPVCTEDIFFCVP